MSACGSKEITCAARALPSSFTENVSAPATTWALVITLLGATTNPLPSVIFWQLCDSPCTLTTLGLALATTWSEDATGLGDSDEVAEWPASRCSVSRIPQPVRSAASAATDAARLPHLMSESSLHRRGFAY